MQQSTPHDRVSSFLSSSLSQHLGYLFPSHGSLSYSRYYPSMVFGANHEDKHAWGLPSKSLFLTRPSQRTINSGGRGSETASSNRRSGILVQCEGVGRKLEESNRSWYLCVHMSSGAEQTELATLPH